MSAGFFDLMDSGFYWLSSAPSAFALQSTARNTMNVEGVADMIVKGPSAMVVQ